MKTVLILLGVLLMLSSCIYADEPGTVTYKSGGTVKSSYIGVGASGIRVAYILDRQNYAVSVGTTFFSIGNLNAQYMTIISPENNSQLAAGFALGYDYAPFKGKAIAISPLIGLMTNLTAGYNGNIGACRPFIGFSLRLGL